MANSTTAPEFDAPADHKPAKRRQYLSGAEVVATATRLYREGYDFTSVAEALQTSPCALKNALWRAGKTDLLKSLRDRQRWNAEPPAEIAIRMLELLPADDLRTVKSRCQELLAEAQADTDEPEPAGRMVRGPGGVVRWVAA